MRKISAFAPVGIGEMNFIIVSIKSCSWTISFQSAVHSTLPEYDASSLIVRLQKIL